MASAFGTVVSVVGSETDGLLDSLEAIRSIDVMRLGNAEPAEAAAIIAASPAVLIVHDADPLVHVAAAWVEFFDDRITFETLSAEIEAAMVLFESGEVAMPDYYLVTAPETIEGTWRHWWLGVLAAAAPRRVLPTPASADAARAQLRRLPTSRPWPDAREWLQRVPFRAPDRLDPLAA